MSMQSDNNGRNLKLTGVVGIKVEAVSFLVCLCSISLGSYPSQKQKVAWSGRLYLKLSRRQISMLPIYSERWSRDDQNLNWSQ